MSFAKFIHHFIIFIPCKNITSISFEFIILHNNTYYFNICLLCYSHFTFTVITLIYFQDFDLSPASSTNLHILVLSDNIKILWLSAYLSNR